MRRLKLIILGVLLGSVAACSEIASAISGYADMKPASRALSLQPQTIFDNAVTEEQGRQRQHIMAFGNWTSHCWFESGAGKKSPFARCTLAPWNGKLVQGKPVPLEAMAAVELQKGRAPMIQMITLEREEGQEVAYQCGAVKWSEMSKPGPIVPVDRKEACRLFKEMEKEDCTISFTSAENQRPVAVKHLANGFSEAAEYARKYLIDPE